jgi:ornithine decarboxylase
VRSHGRNRLRDPIAEEQSRSDGSGRNPLDYFMAFQEWFNRFPAFNYEVQGVYQERSDGRINFYTYAVRQS